MAAIAEDWQEELAPYPSWAIGKAVRWWMSVENADRRRKPLPGDIADRAKREAGILKLAKFHAERFQPAEPEAKPDAPMTDEQRAQFNATLKAFKARKGVA